MSFVFFSKNSAKITSDSNFLDCHLEKYATFVIDFYIFELYVLHFICVDTSCVLLSESRAEIH